MSPRTQYAIALATGLAGLLTLLDATHDANGPRLILGALMLITAALATAYAEHHDHRKDH